MLLLLQTGKIPLWRNPLGKSLKSSWVLSFKNRFVLIQGVLSQLFSALSSPSAFTADVFSGSHSLLFTI